MALTTNLVAYYKLDESSGNAADSSGSGFTLTNTGTIPYSTTYGKINNGASFDGSSQYFVGSASQNITGDATFSFWMKPQSLASDPVLFCKFGVGNTQLSYYLQLNFTSNNVGFVNSADGSTAIGGTTVAYTFSVNTLYYVSLVYTAATPKIELFINGTSIGSSTGTLKTSIFAGTDIFEIGRYTRGNVLFYNGYLDEVGIWSRVLTSTEISSLYNGGAGLQYPFVSSISSPAFLAFM